MKKPASADEYIAGFDESTQAALQQVRAAIKKAAPAAEEVISYQMPGYKYKGMVIWFGAHASHIGLYPKASGIEAFKKELSIYKGAKGTVQFPLDKPMPLQLIARIVKFRMKENEEHEKGKGK